MTLLPVAEARTRLLALGTPVAVEQVPLIGALGRWLAEDIAARRTQPEAPLSAMDGFALRYADLPGPIAVVGESAAGRPFAGAVEANQAVRIFTGAILPPGTDTVLVQEEARCDGTMLRMTGDGPPGCRANVRPMGLDFSAGDVLLSAGERLTPARLALAAAAGHGTLSVRRRVRVAILATGDELVPPGALPKTGQLPESNGVMLAALLASLPVDCVDLGIVPDRLDQLTAAFASIDADIVVTTGGASVGDHDLVRPSLEAAGGAIDFWRIAMRPGKPMMAGRLGGAVVLGLPGNPVSAFVGATLFLRPLVAAMAGARDPMPRWTSAPLGAPLGANDQREDYLRGEIRDGHVFAGARQDSSMLQILARADCLVRRPIGADAAEIGDSVEILPLA